MTAILDWAISTETQKHAWKWVNNAESIEIAYIPKCNYLLLQMNLNLHIVLELIFGFVKVLSVAVEISAIFYT